MRLFLLLIAEYFLIRMDKKIKADDEKLSSDGERESTNE